MQKNYYAVIPANVRYCPSVPDGAKLLYGEITALCNEAGYCWASNKYFADLYNKSIDTIGRWISALAKAGFLFTLVDKESGNSRKIWLAESQQATGKNADTLPAKMPGGYRQKCREATGKNAASYNRYNNTVNNTLNSSSPNGESASEKAFDAQLSVDSGALPKIGYSFEMFWNDYAHKVGSKAKCEKIFGKLSEADREAIRATIEMYKRDTVTTDAGRAGGNFKPLRQHPQTFLNGRVWETYTDRQQEVQATEQPTEFDEAYEKYVRWIESNYPACRRSSTYFTKAHFIELKRNSKAAIIGTESERKFLKTAHERAAIENADAWTIFQNLINERLKSRQV